MGFKDVRAKVIAALQSGDIRNEQRPDADEKNLLESDEVTTDFVVKLLLRCSGDQYETSLHHFDREVLCHVFTPYLGGERWYVKVYFQLSDAVFISVHRS